MNSMIASVLSVIFSIFMFLPIQAQTNTDSLELSLEFMERFPNLSPSEQRLCAFLRLNMSSKEISELTGQSLNALETARYRLRKKLGISNSQVNLITFLSRI